MIKDIYFIKTKELADRLANDNLSDHAAVKHIVVLTILFGAAYEFPIYFQPYEVGESGWSSAYSAINWLVAAAIHYVGINKCFLTSKKNGVPNFFKSFFTLALPVTINVSIIFLLLFVVFFYLIKKIVNFDLGPYYFHFSVVFLALYQGLIYFEINKYLKRKFKS